MQKETLAIAAVKSALSILENHLVENTYLVTDYITLADIISWSNLVIPFKQVNNLSQADCKSILNAFISQLRTTAINGFQSKSIESLTDNFIAI